MGSIFPRGKRLYAKLKTTSGAWTQVQTPFRVGEEKKANTWLREQERKVDEHLAKVVIFGSGGEMSLRAFAKQWLASRSTETVDDDRGRLDNHILPVLGSLSLVQIDRRQVSKLIEALKQTKKLGNRLRDGTRIETDVLIAPRTIRHIYNTLNVMMQSAVRAGLIPSNPCSHDDELPKRTDKNPAWRRTAVFARDELETVISAPPHLIPEDRRMLDALFFLGAMRFGESAALQWRDYDADAMPLGKLIIEKSYSTKSRKVKTTKTDNPREMPVHPTLARMLAEWKLEGFERFVGRKPRPDDLIVPARPNLADKANGTVHARNANHMLRRFHEDLERVGLRARRQHDGRRTFISLARADGARPDILRWVTHGPTGDITDVYTSLPWATLCEEVAKLKISLREGKLIELPVAVNATAATTAESLVQAWCNSSKPSDSAVKSGGADGTRTRGLRRDRPAL